MKVFILEDDPLRVNLLLQWLMGDEVTVIDTCRKAAKFTPPYDIILLDHDLGGRQLERHEDCGLTFVRMVKEKIGSEAQVIVHSYNPEGAKRMVEELTTAGVRARALPFGTGAFRNALDNLHKSC